MIQALIRPEFEARVDVRLVQQTAQVTLEHESVPSDVSLSIVVTGDDEIQSLNSQFRGADTPTDVLSFGQQPTTRPFVHAPDEKPYLGDVILSFPRAQAQAAEQGHSIKEEIKLLVVHGILHLLGYDHATSEEEASMWAKQDAILSTLEGEHDARFYA